MARSISTIQTEILAAKAAEASLAGLTSVSISAYFRAWSYIAAVAINLFEQLLDLFKAEVEAEVAKAVPSTGPWWLDKLLKFQYSATNPQVIQLVNFVPVYNVEDATLRIVTRAAVKMTASAQVVMKVAKGVTGSLGPLNASELAAISSYVDRIQPPGVNTSVISLNPDRLKLVMTVYFDGQAVEAVVLAAVEAAVEAYLAELDFDGTVYLNKLIDKIQLVSGVRDVVISSAIGRDSGTAITSTLLSPFPRAYEATSGYVIPEDTAGHTLNDTITMVAE
jgi:hypothetical protein